MSDAALELLYDDDNAFCVNGEAFRYVQLLVSGCGVGAVGLLWRGLRRQWSWLSFGVLTATFVILLGIGAFVTGVAGDCFTASDDD